MSWSQRFASLRRIDVRDLDMHTIGAWPVAAKAAMGGLLMVLVLLLGYSFQIKAQVELLEHKRSEEVALKEQFASKAIEAANLKAYAAQLNEMETSFSAMLKQLPGDTEVPGLLEDISRVGLGSGLAFEEIKLLPEEARAFYTELPIQITVVGSYHDLATFVSAVAGLSRIVTLHDFRIKADEQGGPDFLRMSILARTYRYSDQGAGQ
ncbi:type 4a pilus biogenesis protein PilO [Pseudomonas akapageensis]|uniref:type 4a pilus biogenesis protein PilO n=1 Tax=Pseudomonas akapageensis TaxID=2609961 RepID=UPI00140DCD4F|nr:type 4a pilus biogenesis protein PilO [Pseudomonas akapageensis]